MKKAFLESRKLGDLVSVGPATLRDFARLGIETTEQLAKQDPLVLYHRMCELEGKRIDPCLHDVFSAAVAQARNPELPEEQRKWWYWSTVRKSGSGTETKARKR